jgi:hypothetical protein
MLHKRTIGILAGGLLLFAPAAQALAAGDGIQVGPALVYPSLSITETHNSNIEMTSDGERADWLTSVAPALRLVLPVQRFYLEAEGGLDFISYRDTSGENSTNWFAGAAVGADFPGGLSFKIVDMEAARYVPTSQEYGPGEDTTENTLRATAGYAIRDALRLEGSWLRKQYTYDLSRDRERVENVFAADLYWKFRPTLSAVFEAGVSDYAYDSNTAQDGSAVQIALGLDWDFTAKSTGFAKAGYQWKRYDDEDSARGTENGSYFTLSGGLRHFFTRRTMAQVSLLRASEESDFPGNPYFVRTVLDATLTQRFTAKLYGRAGVRVGVDQYPNTISFDNPYDDEAIVQTDQRRDDTVEGKLAVGFDATRWLALELAYAAERRNSNVDTFDYTVNRVSLSAKASF